MAINSTSRAIDNALEQYIPLPFDTLMKAGQATQQRYDQSVADDTALQTGLASIEARSPAHKQYVDTQIASYRNKMKGLIDQFGGRLDDPEFKRQAKQIQNQYANDPNFQTIKLSNENIKRSQDFEANLKTKGDLYLSDLSSFKGVDENGKLQIYNGAPRRLNYLNDWLASGKLAHDTKETINGRDTNRGNLERWRNSILSNTTAHDEMKQAYMQQGLNEQQAEKAVSNSIQSMINSYAIDDKPNMGLLSYDLQKQEFNYRKQRDAAEDKLRRDLAASKAGAGKPDIPDNTPSFTEFANRAGVIGTAPSNTSTGNVYIFGSGTSKHGASDVKITNKKISGQIYDIGNGKVTPTSKTMDIKEGTLVGYKNAWVFKDSGKLVMQKSPTSEPVINYVNGKSYTSINGKPVEIEQRTMAEYNYTVDRGTKDKPNNIIKSFYKEASPEDAMEQMGWANAYYRNMGRTSHGSIMTKDNKAKLDYNYIQNSEFAPYLEAYKDAEKNYNNGTPSQTDLLLLDNLNNYDSRKSIYDTKIYPYYRNQGKTKSIVNEEAQ